MHDLHLIEDLAYQPDPIFNLLNTNLYGTSQKPLSIYLGQRQLSQEDICGLNIYLANWSPQLIQGFPERSETKHLFKNANLKFLFSPHSLYYLLYRFRIQVATNLWSEEIGNITKMFHKHIYEHLQLFFVRYRVTLVSCMFALCFFLQLALKHFTLYVLLL